MMKLDGIIAGAPVFCRVLPNDIEDVENEVTQLRWPNDRRLSDVRKLLQSARPVIIGVQQR